MWDQYITGIRFDGVVIDSALYTGDGKLEEVQRQECIITNNNGEGSDEEKNPAEEVECSQCELCRSDYKNSDQSDDCEFCELPELELACDGFPLK